MYNLVESSLFCMCNVALFYLYNPVIHIDRNRPLHQYESVPAEIAKSQDAHAPQSL